MSERSLIAASAALTASTMAIVVATTVSTPPRQSITVSRLEPTSIIYEDNGTQRQEFILHGVRIRDGASVSFPGLTETIDCLALPKECQDSSELLAKIREAERTGHPIDMPFEYTKDATRVNQNNYP